MREALEAVREVAYGIYPPLLVDRGLAETLRAAASRAGVPTRAEVGALPRCPPEVEATVYFCCVEALRNVALRAGCGARATLRAWEEDATLRFEVADDSAGFERQAAPRGTELTGLGDRVDAVGGQLDVVSETGRTVVSGSIPLAP